MLINNLEAERMREILAIFFCITSLQLSCADQSSMLAWVPLVNISKYSILQSSKHLPIAGRKVGRGRGVRKKAEKRWIYFFDGIRRIENPRREKHIL